MMIAIFSDTHSQRGHELEAAALEAARSAEIVVHAGDFTTVAAFDAFEEIADRFVAVHGNADSAPVMERLPASTTLEWADRRLAVTHTRPGGDTALAMFGRERGADVVVSGHTHRARVERAGEVLLLNPGSHAQPRGNRPGFATLEREDSAIVGRMLTPAGGEIERFSIE